LKFSFITVASSSRVRFGLDNAGRRKAPTALTRVRYVVTSPSSLAVDTVLP
jgi:hypothetical protein